MKKPIIAILLAGAFLLMFSTCKKDSEVNIDQIEITDDISSVGTNSVTISGTYSYSGTIDGITAHLSENGVHPKEFVAVMSGKSFAVEMTDLRPGTTYQYYYSVDYGFSKPFKTDTKNFTTNSEAPTVKTLEVQASNDSTIFRVKCKVETDGGSEVSERGICWSTTFDHPTIKDEIIPDSDDGLGVYYIDFKDLLLSTKYYVCAYAKNGSGIGFGEPIDFRTPGETTKPQVSTIEVSDVTYNSASCLCNVSSDGGSTITDRGVCWSENANPDLNSHIVHATEATLGEFRVLLSGLEPNKEYHVRAFATNSKEPGYGDDITFTTTDGRPTVSTLGITDITATSAKGSGEVTDQGASPVTDRGICWSTSHEPMATGNHATNGTGVGSYTCNMTNLTPNETYYVRAYATNTQGTTYGEEVDFVAMEGLPSVETLDVTDMTTTSAKAHYKVSIEGGLEISEHGICWSESNTVPSINDHYISGGNGTGTFSVDLSGLNPGIKYYVRAYAKNTQNGEAYGTAKDFTTEATLPTVTTDGIEGTIAHGTVTADGGKPVTERGICWSLNHAPTPVDLHGSDGTGLGSYTVELTDLQPGKTYYYRAYAINEMGTAYGVEQPLDVEANSPTVTTGEVSNIQQTTAQGSGNVTDDGGADVDERGVCWSTSHNPTVDGSHQQAAQGGTGSFTVNMTGLTANTHYYVRAYAKNRAGKIGYGGEEDFTTSQNISAPTVTTTSPITNITQTTATGGGNVTATGGANVRERGICWSTNHNPTTNGSHASNGTGTGTYTVNMTGLTPGTTYYVRAYAINDADLIGYGSEVSFETQQQSPTTYTITVSTNPSNGGSAHVGSTTGPTTGTYNQGTSCTVYAVANSNYTFTNWTENGSVVSTQANYTFTVTGNRTLVANFTYNVGGNAPQGAINGQFTINGSGDKVYFAKGNLQYIGSAGTPYWKFADNQWDYFGTTTSQNSNNQNVDRDLFGWGTSGYHYSGDPYNVNYQPWSTSTAIVHAGYNYYGYGPSTIMSSPNLTGSSAEYDWGVYNTVFSSNSPTTGWRTLTGGSNNNSEWYYVFNTRSASTLNGVPDARFVKAYVNEIYGVILFPDSYTHPNGVSQPTGINETDGAGWNGNNYSIVDFQQMEQQGAIFLPAAGGRSGTSVYNIGSYGSYWSTSYNGSNGAFYVYFNETNLGTNDYYRYNGRSVRLVCPIQ